MENKEKKPKRVLMILGRVGEFVLEEGLKRIFKGVISRIGGKKNLPSILFLFISFTLYGQYPATGNKQRLGYQTTADGLVWRGRASDTVSLKSSTINNAYIIIDTVNNVMFNYIKTKGGWLFNNTDTVIVNYNFTQPVDSLFFDTSVSPNNVDTAKMRWDYDLATVVLGMYDQVPNELGFKNFWLVKNQTGSTIAKGSVVYASGTVGASGRIQVSKFIANGTIEPKLVLGVTAHDISNGEDGYVIDFGKIRQVNTDTFAAGAILYPSPTTAGAFTDVEPQAPNIDMPIAFCVNSHANNGKIAVRVASGYKMHEIQDVDTTGIDVNGGLVYNGSYFVASNGKLLTPSDTTSLSNRINLKLNLSDTASMLTNYLRTGVAASTYLPLTGGTLTGALDINTNNGLNNYQDSTLKVTYNQSSLGVSQDVTGIYSSVNTTGWTSTGLLSEASTIYTNAIGVKGKVTQSDVNGVGVAYGVIGEATASGSGTNGSTYAGYFNNTSTVGGNHYGLYVSTASGGDYGIYQTGTGTNYFGSNSTFAGNITGNSIIKSGGTSSQFLKADGTTDSNTYLTTSSASSTYLPLTGGTTNGLITSSFDNSSNYSSGNTDNNGFKIYNTTSSTNNIYGGIQFFLGAAGGVIPGGEGLAQIYALRKGGVSDASTDLLFALKGVGGTLEKMRIKFDGKVGIGTSTPSYLLDVNGTFNASGNSLIGGTLNVTNTTTSQSYRIYEQSQNRGGLYTYNIASGTGSDYSIGLLSEGEIFLSSGGFATKRFTISNTGATTITGALTVNNATVLNEDSGDYDTRIESDGNANMVFVDASTDRVGIGTGTPSKTLDVNGEVKIETTTATPTSLLGKDGSNVVGEVTTVAQTGLFTRGETSTKTGTPSAVFTVTHGLGSNPTAVMVTSAGIAGAEKIIYEVYAKNSTTFSVQAWNYDGTEAANKDVKIYWFAIK